MVERRSIIIKKYKTPSKAEGQGKNWKDLSREEKVEHAGFKWYRNHRPRVTGKTTSKEKKQSAVPQEKKETTSEKKKQPKKSGIYIGRISF